MVPTLPGSWGASRATQHNPSPGRTVAREMPTLAHDGREALGVLARREALHHRGRDLQPGHSAVHLASEQVVGKVAGQ